MISALKWPYSRLDSHVSLNDLCAREEGAKLDVESLKAVHRHFEVLVLAVRPHDRVDKRAAQPEQLHRPKWQIAEMRAEQSAKYEITKGQFRKLLVDVIAQN